MDKNFVKEAGEYYLELVPTSSENADWVSIDEYNRLAKEHAELLKYVQDQKSKEVVDKILAERKA